MKTTNNSNLLEAFNRKVYYRAQHSTGGYITLKHAFAAIVCDFNEVNKQIIGTPIALREFAERYIVEESNSIITTKPVPSVDQSVMNRYFLEVAPNRINELFIFQAVISTVCRRPNSDIYNLLTTHLIEPELLLENVSKLVESNIPRTLGAIEYSTEKPVGLDSVIERITLLKQSELGFLIEINSNSRSGKSMLLNYLTNHFSGNSEVFQSIDSKSDNIKELKDISSKKVIIIDDLDEKKDALYKIKKHVFQKGTTVICSTSARDDILKLAKTSPENHICIDISNYSDSEMITILNKFSDGRGDEVFSVSSRYGLHLIGEKLLIAELALTFSQMRPSETFNNCIQLAIATIFEKDDYNSTNLINSLCDLKHKVKAEIFGQDAAVDKICNAIQSSVLGFKTNTARPNGIFALVGASGVGKTQTAREIAKSLGYECLVLNMGEYHSSSHINKLIGAAAGYVGYDKSNGILYDAIQKNSKTIIVLDEIEKADPKIADLFLSCFDSGSINTSSGIEVCFGETIFFLTSNAGISHTTSNIGLTKETNKSHFSFNLDDFKANFRAEFVNRFTDIIEFKQLDDTSLLAITNHSIRRVVTNAQERLNCKISIASDVSEEILKRCEISDYGARPIERLVESIIGSKITKHIIESKNPISSISVSVVNGAITVG
ncbi:AAA family ATPase [Photobacterium damselae]|uniref:AAA family ATPase n=1 Tax=Photobacterium damselae TaxID=38293 RepID=UPI0040691091